MITTDDLHSLAKELGLAVHQTAHRNYEFVGEGRRVYWPRPRRDGGVTYVDLNGFHISDPAVALFTAEEAAKRHRPNVHGEINGDSSNALSACRAAMVVLGGPPEPFPSSDEVAVSRQSPSIRAIWKKAGEGPTGSKAKPSPSLTSLTWTSYRGRDLLDKSIAAARASVNDRSEVQVAVVMAAIAIEAFMNEISDHASSAAPEDARLGLLASALAQFERAHADIKLKVEIAYFILAAANVDKGVSPFQDFTALVALRNALVHPKVLVGNTSDGLQRDGFVRHLFARGLVTEADAEGHVTWDRVIFVPAVATWAPEVAHAVIRLVIEAIPAGQFQEELDTFWPSDLV